MSNSTRKMLRRKPPPSDIDLNLNVNSTITPSAIVSPHSPPRLSSRSPSPQQQQQQPPPPPLPESSPPKPTKPLPPPSSSPPPPPTATATKTPTHLGCLDSSYNISNDFIASANTKIPARPRSQMIHMTRVSYSEQPVQTLQQQQQQQQQQMDYMGSIALESNYINSSFDESFSLADSPKPRGPRDISDYENNLYIDDDNEDDNNHNKNSTILEASPSMNSMQTPSTSILPRSRYQSRRSFQQISRPGAVSSPNQSGLSNVDTTSYSTQQPQQQQRQQQQQQQQQKLPHEIHTPERNLPYPTKPIEDLLAEDIEQGYSFYVDSPSQQRTRAIIDHSVKNTSPQLTDVPNLSNRSSQPTIYVQNRRPSSQYDPESPMSSSPLSYYTPRHKHSTYSFSNEPDIAILPNGQSRSPSPDKLFQSKHNSIISNYQQAEGYFDGHYERNDYNYYSDYNEYTNNDDSGMTNEYTAAPSPNLPRSPQSQYRVVSDNPFYIDENDGNNNMDNYTNADNESPVTDYFDYSILPELPSKVPTSVERKDFPLPSLPDKPLSTVPRTKEKQELPPLPLDLPQLPFNSASLQESHFASCPQVWSLSQIFKWCCKLQIWLAESTISRSDLTKAIVRLLAFHRSDVPLNIITRSSQTAFNAFLQAKAIEVMELHTATDKGDRSIVAFNEHIYVNGVFPELTGCYSPTPHSKDEESLCYASYCNFSKMKNLERKMRNMNIKDIVLANDWASHWRLTIDDLKGIDPTLIKRQSLIFDLLRYEQTFIQRAQCFVEVVCPAFIKTAQTYTSNSKVKKFQSEVLPAARNILEIHQRKLFEPLLKILIAEGKFIMSIIEIVNIYIDWAKEVRSHLMTYTNNMPMIEDLLSIAELKAFVDTKIGVLPRVRELKVNIAILFISTFNSRYQQIPLQLLDIRNKYQENEPEHFLLKQASDEIKGLGSKINDSKRTADNVHAMEQIKAQLSWKSSVKQINLNLNSSNRKFICRGDLTRKSDLKLTTQINHLVILDNYLLITERVKNPKISGILYKICEDPIPIDFLMFSQKVAGSTVYPIKLASTSSFRTPIQQQLQQQQQQPQSYQSHQSQQQQQQQSSQSQTNAQLDEDDSIQYAVRLQYAGKPKHSFTFSCKTEREKDDWISYLTMAKTNMCKRLFNSAAYIPHPLSTTCFAYEFHHKTPKLPISVPFDQVYDMCQDSRSKLMQLGIGDDVMNGNLPRSRLVHSSIRASFSFIYKDLRFTLVGLSSGLYCCESKSRWKRIAHCADITKIHVDTNTGIVVVLTDKQLRYYLIHQILNVYSEVSTELSAVALSNSSVSFFSMAVHKNITMLFLAKRKGSSTSFKVLIPETDNNGVFSRFKNDRKFFIEAECYGISIFNSSFAVHTDKGFEILDLDKMVPRSVPDLPSLELENGGNNNNNNNNNNGSKRSQFTRNSSTKSASSLTPSTPSAVVDNIKKLILSSRVMPLGMFKLNNNSEFLLVYDDFAIFINKYGKLSRYVILIFDFKARSAYFRNNDLFLIKDDVLEVLSISDFPKGTNKFVQVITGRDIRLVSSAESENITIAMANPLVPGMQLFFNMVPKPDRTIR